MKKGKYIIFSIIGIVIVSIAISAALFIRYINEGKDYKSVFAKEKQDKTDKNIPEKTSEENKDIQGENPFENSNVVNLLLLGLDRTEERDKTIGVYRTDTIVLLSIDLNSKNANVVSIPRDSYVYIDKIGKKDKINHAYVWGGMGEKGIQSTIDTVERFGKYFKVDHYFCMEMQAVPEIVDSLGGVDINVDVDMKGDKYGDVYNLDKGFQHLDGQKAFQFIHWRWSGAGDIDRIMRQQRLAKAMLEKIKEENGLVDSAKIVMNYSQYIKTDMNLKHMIALASLFKDISSENITYNQIPGNDRLIDGIWYWIPDEAKSDEIFKRIFHNQ